MAQTLELLQHALAGRYRVERELGRGGIAISKSNGFTERATDEPDPAGA